VAALLRRVLDQGLPLTLHAGEADAGVRVVEAARLGARRVGHGVRFADLLDTAEGPALVDELKAAGLHFEVCPTSNVHTGAATSVATHPIRRLWDAGLPVSFHPDNRLMSCVSMSEEAVNLHRELGFSWDELRRMGLAAADASFMPEAAKALARSQLQAWQAPT
jgi:adenosine deaminase